MTTPPDTPKPPAELFIIPPQGREVVGDAFVDAGTATRAMKDRKASTVHRYILAPSPQESHKLAEELGRAFYETEDGWSIRPSDAAYLLAKNRDAILAALRSSEQDARDAKRYRFLRDDKTGDADTGISINPSQWDAAIDVAIAASGGAKE